MDCLQVLRYIYAAIYLYEIFLVSFTIVVSRANLKTLPAGTVTEEQIEQEHSFINKHLRLSEEMTRHSSSAQMVLVRADKLIMIVC